MNKAVKASLIVVLVLGVLLVGADRIGASVAAGKIADQVALELKKRDIAVKGAPDVSIDGFPFLTQVVGGEYQGVTINLAEVHSTGLAINELKVHATGVRAALSDVLSGKGSVTAAKITGTGAIAYSSFVTLLDQPDLSIVPEKGKLKIRTKLAFAGQSVNVVGAGTVSYAAGHLVLTVSDFKADGGALPPGVAGLLSKLAGTLSQDIKLPELPYGLTINSIEVADDGLRVQASASDVPLSG